MNTRRSLDDRFNECLYTLDNFSTEDLIQLSARIDWELKERDKNYVKTMDLTDNHDTRTEE